MKNYTTKIAVSKTIGEITELLTEHYARDIMIQNDENRKPKGIVFSLVIDEKKSSYLLEANVDATLRAMIASSKVTKAQKNKEQAERTAWRNLKAYLEIKLAFIAVEQNKKMRMLEMQKEFFASMVDKDRKTLFQNFRENNQKLLTQ